jgi:hypothetical protein
MTVTTHPRTMCGAILALPLALSACQGEPTASNVPTPGDGKSAKTTLLETGAAVLQDKPPVDALNAYLDGFHFYNGDLRAQMEAHHYCAVLGEDLMQCVIFDGNRADAKLMGVEYVVGRALFEALPQGEKALWHSHVHEVKSGQLIAPGIPDAAEHELMEKLVNTYGKTFHTWHTDRGSVLPMGLPQVMMGFTADGQADTEMVGARDRRFGISSDAVRARRADIAALPVAAGADAWQSGVVIQIEGTTGHGKVR